MPEIAKKYKITRVNAYIKQGLSSKDEYAVTTLLKEYSNTVSQDLELRNGKLHIPKHKLN